MMRVRCRMNAAFRLVPPVAPAVWTKRLSFASGWLERRLLSHDRHTTPDARPETGFTDITAQTLLPVEMAVITTLDKTANW